MEIYWLIVNTANTLSEEIWGAERIDFAHPLDFAAWTPLHWGLSLAFWLFFAWLSVHFPFGALR